jgi:hypothetical protein
MKNIKHIIASCLIAVTLFSCSKETAQRQSTTLEPKVNLVSYYDNYTANNCHNRLLTLNYTVDTATTKKISISVLGIEQASIERFTSNTATTTVIDHCITKGVIWYTIELIGKDNSSVVLTTFKTL